MLCYSAELCWLSARVDCFSVLSIAVYHLMWAVVQKMNPESENESENEISSGENLAISEFLLSQQK